MITVRLLYSNTKNSMALPPIPVNNRVDELENSKAESSDGSISISAENLPNIPPIQYAELRKRYQKAGWKDFTYHGNQRDGYYYKLTSVI